MQSGPGCSDLDRFQDFVRRMFGYASVKNFVGTLSTLAKFQNREDRGSGEPEFSASLCAVLVVQAMGCRMEFALVCSLPYCTTGWQKYTDVRFSMTKSVPQFVHIVQVCGLVPLLTILLTVSTCAYRDFLILPADQV